MSDLCADPACAQIREWYLADEVKLAQIRKAVMREVIRNGVDREFPLKLKRIVDGKLQP